MFWIGMTVGFLIGAPTGMVALLVGVTIYINKKKAL